jgi:hypothetical protein
LTWQDQLLKYISAETLLATEDQILEAVLKWFDDEYYKKTRVDDRAAVLGCIRFDRMPAKRMAELRSAGIVPDLMVEDALLKQQGYSGVR